MSDSAWLIPLPGAPGAPPLEPLELSPTPGGLVIGRHEQCELQLPASAESVSRHHAHLIEQGGRWRIVDLNSRWGTFVNGVKLTPHREMPLKSGDLIRIAPWTFSFSTQGLPQHGLLSVDDRDTATMLVRSVTSEQAKPLQEDMLNLLLQSASALHAAGDELALANVLLDTACRGTGLPNATILRALDAGGRVEVLASRMGPALHEAGAAAYSRTLLATASQGTVVELSADSDGQMAQSIVDMKIDAAICAPLMLGTTVAAYLYLDSRSSSGGARRALNANASSFCRALANMAGLALANLKRIEMERRAALIEAELGAAAAAQRWILPRVVVRCGPFACSGRSRPGQYLGGDFFDAMTLPDGRLAVSLGDVCGHGIAASVLMTASQGFLHAALNDHGDPARAVTELNAFLHPRRPEGKFVTLWVGVFDAREMTVTYVDAGHGYALLSRADQTFEHLSAGDGLPLAIVPDSKYTTATASLAGGCGVLILSDGIIEQFAAEPSPAGERRQFKLSGVQAALAAAGQGEDAIERIFQAVYQFAGTQNLADDATAVLVRW